MSDCMRTDPTVSFVAMIELACAMIKSQNYELIAVVDEGDERVCWSLGSLERSQVDRSNYFASEYQGRFLSWLSL